jgi:hypothetical protein
MSVCLTPLSGAIIFGIALPFVKSNGATFQICRAVTDYLIVKQP